MIQVLSGSSNHFTPLQPLLSNVYSPIQIRALLTVSLLFWQKPTYTDTQLADNPHLYSEFINPGRATLSPFLIKTLQGGEGRLLLRSRFYNQPNEPLFECKNLADVYRGWQTQNEANAWVVPPNVANRNRYIDAWDSQIPDLSILSYDYLSVKQRFQANARSDPDWSAVAAEVGSSATSAIRSIVAKEWFSHSELHATLKKVGFENGVSSQMFGLLDESAYAQEFGHGLTLQVGSSLAVKREHATSDLAEEHIRRILADGFKSVDAADLALLGTLEFAEVMAIRESGSFLIDRIHALGLKKELDDGDYRDLALALAEYWKIISDGLATFHPGAVKHSTRIGLALGTKMPVEKVEHGVSIAIAGLFGLLAGAAGTMGMSDQTGFFGRLVDGIPLRFIVKSDDKEMLRLRSVFSRASVVAASKSAALAFT